MISRATNWANRLPTISGDTTTERLVGTRGGGVTTFAGLVTDDVDVVVIEDTHGNIGRWIRPE